MFSPSPLLVHPKLTINAPGDRYEQEADRIAEQVMQTPRGGRSTQGGQETQIRRKPLLSQISRVVQRMPTETEEEENEKEGMLQTKPISSIQRKCAKCANEEEEKQTIQTKSNTASPQTAKPSLAARIQRSRGQGTPMDSATQHFMSSRFGTDFTNVRIHTDSTAAKMSQEINAQAFTTGRDVYFNRGKYSPHTPSGKQLLAHELVHVVQQGFSQNSNRLSLSRENKFQQRAIPKTCAKLAGNAVLGKLKKTAHIRKRGLRGWAVPLRNNQMRVYHTKHKTKANSTVRENELIVLKKYTKSYLVCFRLKKSMPFEGMYFPIESVEADIGRTDSRVTRSLESWVEPFRKGKPKNTWTDLFCLQYRPTR